MTIRIEHRIGVAATTERVWEIIADLERWSEWNPLHPEISGRIAIGGSLELVERLEGEPERRAQVTVPDWTPETQLIWADKRGFMARSRRYFELEALGEGQGCILANGEIFEGWRGEDWAAARRRKLRAAYEAVNEAIKARAEA